MKSKFYINLIQVWNLSTLIKVFIGTHKITHANNSMGAFLHFNLLKQVFEDYKILAIIS